MSKSLKVIDPKPLAKREEMELLVSHDGARKPRASNFSAQIKLHIVLLLLGTLGTIGCLWAMLDTHNSKLKMQELGLHKVANSLDNILQLLAYPVLMFSVILTAYAAQQLFRAYRTANDPETYRQQRRAG